MYLEMKEGRSINGKRYLHLDVRPETVNHYAAEDGRTNPDGTPYRISKEDIIKKLPEIIDFSRTYMGVDPLTAPMPVQPTAHYAMGGVPTNMNTEVILDRENSVLPGLYAAGELACVSVHGANRLGTNSLLDIIVFGRAAGKRAAKFAQDTDFRALPSEPERRASAQLRGLRQGSGVERAGDIRVQMQQVMFEHVGVFRTREGMGQALAVIRELKERYGEMRVDDTGHVYNTDLLEAWELGCMLDVAEVTAASALAREESRGAHAREDFDQRDDESWLKHTLAYLRTGSVDLEYKPVTITDYPPEERGY
jgi:succinate dehydrogenase / fumarate reductase flavoprotein subunit